MGNEMKKKILASILVGLMLSLIISSYATSARPIEKYCFMLNVHVYGIGEKYCPPGDNLGIEGANVTIIVHKKDGLTYPLFSSTNENGWIDDRTSADEPLRDNYWIPRGSDIHIIVIKSEDIIDEETNTKYRYRISIDNWYYNVLENSSSLVFSVSYPGIGLTLKEVIKSRDRANPFPFLSNFPFFQKLLALPIFGILFN